MKRLYEKYQNDKELVFVTVSVNSYINAQNMKDILRTNNIFFPVLLDMKGETVDTYAPAIPITYFIDRMGIVRDRILGVGTLTIFEQGIAKIK